MSEISPVPFPGSYWVIPGKLLAGPYPGHLQPAEADRRITALLACGIRRVINLMEAEEVNYQGQPFVPYIGRMQEFAGLDTSVAMNRFPIRDGEIPSRDDMRKILNEIDAALTDGQPVYIHCWGGKGRTGTAVGCYLIRHGLASAGAALERINHLRRDVQPFQPSPENERQCAFVCSWNPDE